MRKSPTFNSLLVCDNCGETTERTGTRQKFCRSCSNANAAIRKKEHAARKHPDRVTRDEFINNAISRKPCTACGEPSSGSHGGLPYCNKHWQRIERNGTVDLVGRKSTNSFETVGDKLVVITQSGDVILADADDYDRLKKYSWCISKTGYAVANINYRVTKMHRYIMLKNLSDSVVVDHANGNRLDNRKTNLRICTQNENGKNIGIKKTNSHGVQGIRRTQSGKYRARIFADGKELHIGTFQTLKLAVEARKRAEIEHFGEFAPCLRNTLTV